MADIRHCFNENVTVYEITGQTQIEVYEAALKTVKDRDDVSFFQIDTFLQIDDLWVGTLRLHLD